MNWMDILQTIRTNVRTSGRAIISHLENHFLSRENGKARLKPIKPICLFCGTNQSITKEHILPRWAFEKHPDRTFKTTINGFSHKYNQTTIPACATCNNILLNELEKQVLQLFSTHNLPDEFFNNDELSVIIRWVELLDYKFQVFSLVTRFRAVAGQGDIPFLRDYSLSVLDPNIDYSPAKALGNLRRSLYRITIKGKDKNLNSLVVFKTSNPDISFFHKNNDYMFLELPKHKIAVLYFYELIFRDVFTARDSALEVIKKHY